jgi:aminocarboxymuconate-semialdehyde decarboxylase
MGSRREFLRGFGAASFGIVGLPCTCGRSLGQTALPRREISVAGSRVRTIDIHCHCGVADVLNVVAGTDLERPARGQINSRQSEPIGPERLAIMDRQGIDTEVLTINPWWYSAGEDLARRIIDVQNEKLAAMTAAYPGRIYAFASVALQFPELAAQQLETGMKQLGLKGAAIGGNVEGEELSARKYDPFWAKAEELQALIFIHPQDNIASTGIGKRIRGSGALANVIGNPLETTFALAHLIFEGTLDRFPNLKLCAAHGGGFLPSYAGRMDHGCEIFPNRCKGPALLKRPSEYLRQLYFDSLVFTPEGLRHLVAECGVGQIMVGTDTAIPWVSDPVDQVLQTPGLGDADRIAILGGTAAKLLRLEA